MNLFRQIHRADPRLEPRCIFDIGANVGQTVAAIRAVFPAVPVHAFEPVAATFALLADGTAADTATQVHRLAFGARPGRATMIARPGSQQNRILPERTLQPSTPQEGVEVVSGETFCAAHGIAEIDILKIDTEGHDLEVLVGFHGMLVPRRIRYVIAECGVSPRNRTHVPFGRLAEFMFALGYGLFGLFPGPGQPWVGTNRARAIRGHGIWQGDAIFIAEPWADETS